MVDGRLNGHDLTVEAVSTDSRSLQPGDLFVALRGERFDAHDFVGQPGMTAALVEQLCESPISQILVEDTLAALGLLAQRWRARFAMPIVGLTGSNGKTTVKEMISAILALRGRVHATRGNLNNHIGVPLTLLKLRASHDFGVIEMGANHAGEIAYLAGLARPDIGLITNAGPAHLEGFGSIEGVVRAKGELFESLGETQTAVINADDAAFGRWCAMAAPARLCAFGFSDTAEIRGLHFDDGVLSLTSPHGTIDISLPLSGRHNALNALAAIAVGTQLGIALKDAKAGLESMLPVGGRLCRLPGLFGSTLIDDSYNANPASMAAALDVLAGLPGERWFVMGDMGELGPDAATLHAQMGRKARDCGIERLYAVGPLCRAAADAFGEGVRYFEAVETLIDALKGELNADVTVLIKASRSAKLERVVQALRAHEILSDQKLVM